MAEDRSRRRASFSVASSLAAVLVTLALIGLIFLSELRPDRAPIDPTVGPTTRSAPGRIAVVTTDALNVRDGASLDAPVIDTLSQGARLDVLGETRNGYTPVRYGTGQAWIASEFLTIDDSMPVPGGESRAMAPVDRERHPSSVLDADVGVSAEEAVAHERWIDVDRTTGTVALHVGETTVTTYKGKTGSDPSANGFYATAPGTFHVFSMSKELAETPFAEGVYLTDWVGFDPVRSNGFHSPTRDASGNIQVPQNATTLGCVRLDADDAARVFDFAFIGMRVEVH